MKRNLFRLPFPLMLFALILLGTSRLSAQEAYAVLNDNGTCVTFYYDDLKASRVSEGVIVELSVYDAENKPEWATEILVSATFDESFAAYNGLTSLSCWFYGCDSMVSVDGLTNLSSISVTDMSGMFYGCSSLASLDLSGFDTGNVVNMQSLFANCSSLTNIDVSPFNTAKVTNMKAMFYGCSSLTSLDLSGLNTQKLMNMNLMFGNCSSLRHLDLSGFDTEAEGLSGIDYTMRAMFQGCSSLETLDISSFNTQRIPDMVLMFCDCSALSTIYVGDGWSKEHLTSSGGGGMFLRCNNLVGGAGTVYDANHVDAEYARVDGGTESPGYFTQKPREAYAVLSTDSTSVTFYYDEHKIRRKGLIIDFPCSSPYPWANAMLTTATFDNSFANFDGLTSLHRWFSDCTALTTINGLSNLNTANVVYMGFMFANCSSLETLDVSNFNTSNVTNMSHLFSQCKKLKSLDLSEFDTKNTTNIGWMFNGCSSLSSLDLSSFDTKNVTYMDDMFWRCSSLTSLNLSSFNTENVTTMLGMFSNCPSLTNLDLSSFDTKNVTDMKYMFEYCRSLNTIFVGEMWTTEQVTAHDKVFNECTSLVGGAGTVYDASHVDAEYARVDDPDNGQPGYFTAKYVGDVNGDSSVNVSDVTSLVGIILGNSEPNSAADVNKDGEVNVSDVTAIVSIILGND